MNKKFPDNWQNFNLKDICFFQEGPGLRNWQYRDKGTKFINIRCINDGYLNLTDAQYLSSEEVESKYKHFLLNEGDYVLSSSGSIGRIAVVKKNDLPLLLNTSVIRFRTIDKSKLDMKFLFYFLQSIQFFEKIYEQSQGSAQINFGPTHLNQLSICLPSLPEQYKISEILSRIDILITSIKVKIRKQEILNFAIGKNLIEQINVKNIYSIGDIYEVKSGSTPSRSCPEFYCKKDGIPWVKTLDLTNEYLYKTDEELTELGLDQIKRNTFSKGTVLIAMYGGWNQIGRTGILTKDSYCNQAMSALLPNERVVPEFINMQLVINRSYWKKVAASSRKDPNITKSDVKEMKIYLPSIAEQARISKIYCSNVEYSKQLQRKLKSLLDLKLALSNDLLSGRKRVKI